VSVRQQIEEHLRSEEVSRVIYGAIIGLALILVLEHHPPSAAAVEATLIATGFAVGLAELYSEIIGEWTRLGKRVERHRVRHMLKGVGAVFAGIVCPGVYFILAALHLMKLDTAFTLAKWSGLVLIALYGYAAGRLSGASRATSVMHALSVAAVGAALIGFKALVH
jgi:hypothetical protein